MSEDEVFSRIEKLSEVNPMLGFRGCRSSFHLTIFSLSYLLKYLFLVASAIDVIFGWFCQFPFVQKAAKLDSELKIKQ